VQSEYQIIKITIPLNQNPWAEQFCLW